MGGISHWTLEEINLVCWCSKIKTWWHLQTIHTYEIQPSDIIFQLYMKLWIFKLWWVIYFFTFNILHVYTSFLRLFLISKFSIFYLACFLLFNWTTLQTVLTESIWQFDHSCSCSSSDNNLRDTFLIGLFFLLRPDRLWVLLFTVLFHHLLETLSKYLFFTFIIFLYSFDSLIYTIKLNNHLKDFFISFPFIFIHPICPLGFEGRELDNFIANTLTTFSQIFNGFKLFFEFWW
jgi:hypothetical protein